jgi:hypothetical protein
MEGRGGEEQDTTDKPGLESCWLLLRSLSHFIVELKVKPFRAGDRA